MNNNFVSILEPNVQLKYDQPSMIPLNKRTIELTPSKSESELQEAPTANAHLFTDFLNFLIKNQFDQLWSQQKCSIKINAISFGCMRIFLRLIVPVVNYELPKNGWCKLAVMVNVFFGPPIFLLTSRSNLDIGRRPHIRGFMIFVLHVT